MKNLSFSQKNDLVVKHKSKTGFWKDLELFKKHFPSNRLMNDLARANDFTCERLDGQMLYQLLEILFIEEILNNRISTPVDENPATSIFPEKTPYSKQHQQTKIQVGRRKTVMGR